MKKKIKKKKHKTGKKLKKLKRKKVNKFRKKTKIKRKKLLKRSKKKINLVSFKKFHIPKITIPNETKAP